MDTINHGVWLLFSLLAGLAAGRSTVYVFNRIPAKWLCDYGQEPDKGMWGERIRKEPWDLVFSLVFMAASVKLHFYGPLYFIAGLLALWLLLQIGIADKKYLIIPDQFIIAFAAAALVFLPFQASFLSPLYGALIGGGSFFAVGILGRLFYKRDAVGFGDVKLLTVVGMAAGTKGILLILLLTIFSSALILGTGTLTGRIHKGVEQPLGPFIAVSAAACILFREESIFLVNWYFSYF